MVRLMGNRGNRLYPPRPNLPTNRRGVVGMYPAQQATAGTPGLFSRQSLMILTVGMLMGYLVLPMLLMQRLGAGAAANQYNGFGEVQFKTTLPNDYRPSPETLQYSQYSPDAGAAIVQTVASSRRMSPAQEIPAAALDEVNKVAVTADIPEEHEMPEIPDEHDDPDHPDHVEKKKKNLKKNKTTTTSTTKETDVSGVTTPSSLKRIMEDQDILARQSIPTSTTPNVMKTNKLPDSTRMKILVTGGAGFVGSHLVDKLMMEGHEVTVVDNFFTGQKKNIAHWLQHPNFSVIVHDVTEPIQLEVDQIYHLACPASPPHYQYNPVKTIKTSTMGTLNMLGLAKRVRARILLTSTSEIYGDPKEHPQKESYWGNVNTIGPRSCYDEGKRVAETMMYSYRNQNAVEVRVARIFNTFGPRMHPNDGRVVSNFIIQALQNKNLTIYGEGTQTRSFQYVSDLVDGLHKLMNGHYDLPVNLGNPDEYSVGKFAEVIKEMTQSESEIIKLEKSQDDPSQRKPDITTAKREINWEPKVAVKDGLEKTISYFQSVLDESGEIVPTGPGAAKPEA